ncbi:MAG: hypothetical protein WCR33_04100 [Bacilli bacterium]|jgi:hypothetical protein
MKLKDFVAKGLTVVNDMGETRKTSEHSIVFPNGWVGSIVKPSDGSAEYSVAVCDYNGYFNWNVLRPFGTDKGVILCKDEQEVCRALSIIEMLNNI